MFQDDAEEELELLLLEVLLDQDCVYVVSSIVESDKGARGVVSPQSALCTK